MRGNKVVKINLKRKKKDESQSITETKSLFNLPSLSENLLRDPPFFPNEAPFSDKSIVTGHLMDKSRQRSKQEQCSL